MTSTSSNSALPNPGLPANWSAEPGGGSRPLAIRAHGLTKLFGDFPALQNVDLEVPQGEFLAVLGRNGAGKSTLLKLLAMLTRPTLGTLAIGGIGRDGDRDQVRRPVARPIVHIHDPPRIDGHVRVALIVYAGCRARV